MLLMYNEDMKVGGIIIGGACAILASFISVHFFLDPAPEFRTVVSTDGVFALEGRVYESQQFFIEEEPVLELLTPFSSVRYRVLPLEGSFVQPLEGSFFVDADHAVMYRFDDVGAYWVALPNLREDDQGYAHVALSSGGLYALGSALSVDAPTFVDVVSDFRSRLPLGAVSYRIQLVAQPNGGVPFLLDSFLERGGCGGVPAVGQQSFTMQDERTIQVLVNDVLTPTDFTFLMEIETSPEGCPEDMPMQVIF